MAGSGAVLPVELQVPPQMLDAHERRASIFVDRNGSYNLREGRDLEQARLQLSKADQEKFGKAFTKFQKVGAPAWQWDMHF